MKNYFIKILFAAAFTLAASDAEVVVADTVGVIDTVNIVDTVSVIDTINIADMADTLDMSETADMADTVSADTVTAASEHASANPDGNEDTRADVNPSVKKTTLAGLDIGLAIGGVQVFELWQESLPLLIGDLGLAPNFMMDSIETGRLVFRVTESPTNFNFVLPFGISLHHAERDRMLSLALSAVYSSRQFQSEIFVETTGDSTRKIDVQQSMSFTSLTLEAAYHQAINPAIFSINGSRQTFFTAALGVSPINTFSRRNDIKKNLHDGDDDLRMNAVYDTLQNYFTKLTGTSIALTWRVGITTLRERGLLAGIYYSGSYALGFSNRDGDDIQTGQLNRKPEDDSPLSFLSSKIEFRISFTRSLRRNTEEISDE